MTSSKIKKLKNDFNSIETIDKEIIDLKKKLLNLRITKKTYQLKNPHQFKLYRKRIARLNFLKKNLSFNSENLEKKA